MLKFTIQKLVVATINVLMLKVSLIVCAKSIYNLYL